LIYSVSLRPAKLKDAERWLASAGGGSDGVIAKRLDLPYQTGNREGTQKIKKYRSADCVIGGFRYGENLQAGRNDAESNSSSRFVWLACVNKAEYGWGRIS
jgi:ATP-dependent DNA ligase